MLNNTVVVGRIVRNPELKETETGRKVANITLAVPRAYKNIEGEYETDADPSHVAEAAFADGIRNAVAEKFYIDKENIRVKIRNFDMEKMSCDQIMIFLDGAGVFADYRGIEEYINGFEMGECEVEITLGKGK